MSSGNSVLVVGRIYADVIFTGLTAMPTLGREEYAKDVTVTPGGGAYITAAVLAGLDTPVVLCASLPTHAINQSLLPFLHASGIDLDGIERGCADQPQMTVAIAHDDDRAFVTRRVGPSVPDSYVKLLAREDIGHVHIAELATLADAPDMVSQARDAGKSVSLDCAWDEAVLAQPGILDLLAGVDLFLPNSDEARALVGHHELTLKTLRPLSDRVPDLVVKRGARGCLGISEGKTWSVIAPKAEVIDSTGAGDSFNAGFLHARLGGHDFPTCLTHGVAAGTLSVSMAGGSEARPDAGQVAADAAMLAAAMMK